MSRAATPESGTRNRTRRAILSTAASVLARNTSATLGDIADAAEVGRTTLHRYFPDRESLIRATIEDSLEAVERSTRDAAIGEGPPGEAMRRLVAAMVQVSDRLAFLFGDPRILEGYDNRGAEDMPDPVLDLIRRGQAEGVFDPDLTPRWIQHVLWALVYTGWEEVNAGRLPRHGVTATVIRTFERGVHRAPPPPAAASA